MINTAIDTFYLSDDQLENSPSRKEGVDAQTEMNIRIYGCDLIHESGMLLKLPQAVMATAQVLFHRFYCKKSFFRFDVKRVASSCVWLAAKLEESPRKAKHVIIVFHRMELRRENLPIEHLDLFSKQYSELKNDLIRTERHLLKEMGFICHVEHPHKFISNYLAALEAPPELKQEAWNLANDSLRTTLCVRFKSEVVACGVVYAAARRVQVPLPENPPWWNVFDADIWNIEKVCRVLAHLYSLPKAQYISVCKDNHSFARIRTPDPQAPIAKEAPAVGSGNDNTPRIDPSLSKEARKRLALDKLNWSKKNEDDGRKSLNEGEMKDIDGKSKGGSRSDINGGRNKEKDRDKDRSRASDRERGRDPDGRGSMDSERDRERGRDVDRDKDKRRERSHHSKGKGSGHSEKSRNHSSRDHSEYRTSHSSRDKDHHRHHPFS